MINEKCKVQIQQSKRTQTKFLDQPNLRIKYLRSNCTPGKMGLTI